MFCFCWKFFSTVLPFLENNIHKLLNIYQMIQICQGFQPNFKSFMKSLIGYISNNLADENVTGEDFSTFFTWPLGHKPLCVSIWNSYPTILTVLVQFRSSCYQQINIQKKMFILWEHLFPMKRPCVLASVTNLFSQPPPTHISTICPLNKISSQNQFNFVILH